MNSNNVYELMYFQNQIKKSNNIIESDNMKLLYRLHELDFANKWNYEIPTLVSVPNDDHPGLHKDYDFTQQWLIDHPEFKLFLANETILNHVLIAGGSIAKVLMNGWQVNKTKQYYENLRNNYPDELIVYPVTLQSFLEDLADIDLFIYGTETEYETNDISQLICTLLCQYYNNTKLYNVVLIYHKNVLNIYVYKKDLLKKDTKNLLHWNLFKKYQIIYKLNKNIESILYHFDFGSSQVGFNFKELLFTKLSKFTYETKCNILDVNNIKNSQFEERAIKYLYRGFALIVPPYFNIENFKENRINVIKFSKLYFYVDFNHSYNNPNYYKVLSARYEKTNPKQDQYKTFNYFENLSLTSGARKIAEHNQKIFFTYLKKYNYLQTNYDIPTMKQQIETDNNNNHWYYYFAKTNNYLIEQGNLDYFFKQKQNLFIQEYFFDDDRYNHSNSNNLVMNLLKFLIDNNDLERIFQITTDKIKKDDSLYSNHIYLEYMQNNWKQNPNSYLLFKLINIIDTLRFLKALQVPELHNYSIKNNNMWGNQKRLDENETILNYFSNLNK